MNLGKAELRQAWEDEIRKNRRKMLLIVLVTIAIFCLCMCFRAGEYNYTGTIDQDLFRPGEHYRTIFWGILVQFSRIFQGNIWHQRLDLLDPLMVTDTIGRLKITGMAVVAGAGLAISGAIFQTVYKNPLASPGMLGAGAGVQLGNAIIVLTYSTSAWAVTLLRYKYCYAITAVCVAVILALGRLSGDKRGNPSVLQMVMAGSIINQLIGTMVQYIMYFKLDEDELWLFQTYSMGTNVSYTATSLIIFFTVMAVGLIPMILLRYRFNVTGIDDSESRVAGVNPAPYRLVGQICGVVLVTAAMIHCGEAGMLAMVIPYIVRNAIGSDFRKVFAYSALSGGCLMMICRTLTGIIPLHNAYGDLLVDADQVPITLPVTFIINICLLPFFVLILIRQGRAFD